MADSSIGALPQAVRLEDDSLLVAEQQGQAVKVTGAQFKEFGRQAVVGQVQGYVDAAQAAAEEAAEAVSAVADMTVEAYPSQEAAVSKSTREGRLHLSFGLPRGERGLPGPEGPAGAQGPRGERGRGLDILGYYPSLEALRGAVAAPEAGDAYGIGGEPPYSIYIFDGVALDWKDNGPLGGGGGTLPENVVTAPGGAELAFSSGDGPHRVTFTFEEEQPLRAEDIVYSDTQDVKQAIDGLKASVSDGKQRIASAVTDMGVPTPQDATFAQMEENIRQISTGSDTSDATAAPGDILAGKTAYTAAGKITGIIPTLAPRTITPGAADQTIASGQYLGGDQTVRGDPGLISANIKKGVSIFGVEGALEPTFLATLTVTADVGAVVTATHAGGTEVEALSTTGAVVLELPLEGEWTVTAVRGLAQYNTATVHVTSQYAAALTAEVHIEYVGTGTSLGTARSALAAASVGDYALFGGGYQGGNYADYANSADVDVYDLSLTKSKAANIIPGRRSLGAASVGDYVLFGGGMMYSSGNAPANYVDIYDSSLTKNGTTVRLADACYHLGAASFKKYALFAGGVGYSSKINTVNAFDEELVRTSPDGLASAAEPSGSSNGNYVIFGGGNVTSVLPTAYDEFLAKVIPTALSKGREDTSASRAGNYVLFAGGTLESRDKSNIVEAYDLFLTRTIAEPLSTAKSKISGITIHDIAVFAGDGESADCYDPYLVHTTVSGLERVSLAAALNGNFGLFGGGDGDGLSSRLDIYRYV